MKSREMTLVNKFEHESDLIDGSRHRKWITTAIFCKSDFYEYVVCTQERSNAIQIFNTKMRPVWETTLKSH